MRLRRFAAYLALVSAVALWAGNWVMARWVRDDISPGTIVTGRLLIVLAVLAPLALPGLAARLRGLERRDWRLLVAIGVFGGGLHNALQYLGLQQTTATNGTLLFSMSPVLILLMARGLRTEPIGVLSWAGVAVSFAGVLMIATRGSPLALDPAALNPGDLLCLASSVMWAAYTLCVGLRRDPLDPLQLLFVMAAIGLATVLPWLAWDVAYDARAQLNFNGIAALVYSGLASLILAYALWNYGVARLGASRSGAFTHLIPALAVGLAAVLLGERPLWFHGVGLTLILAGIALSNLRR